MRTWNAYPCRLGNKLLLFIVPLGPPAQGRHAKSWGVLHFFNYVKIAKNICLIDLDSSCISKYDFGRARRVGYFILHFSTHHIGNLISQFALEDNSATTDFPTVLLTKQKFKTKSSFTYTNDDLICVKSVCILPRCPAVSSLKKDDGKMQLKRDKLR